MLSDPTNPEYRLDLEVLCLLPLEPIGVPLALIAADLDTTQAKLRTILDKLARKGMPVRVWKISTGFVAALEGKGWLRAQAIGCSYLDQLTGHASPAPKS